MYSPRLNIKIPYRMKGRSARLLGAGFRHRVLRHLRRRPVFLYPHRGSGAKAGAIHDGDSGSALSAVSGTVGAAKRCTPQIPTRMAAEATALISAGMLLYDWRMALALLWVVPASLLMVYLSRRMEKQHIKKGLVTRRAATDAMQEVLECAPEIKACNQKARYIADLNRRLDEAERDTIRGELFTGRTGGCGLCHPGQRGSGKKPGN